MYTSILHSPFHVLTFLFLIAAFTSLWMYSCFWIWGTFLSLSALFATLSQTIEPISLVFLIGLLLLHIGYRRCFLQTFYKWALFLAIIALSFLLLLHQIPGFNNWKIFHQAAHSHVGAYTLYFNYDKPFVGFFVLAINHPLIDSRAKLARVSLRALPLTLLTAALLLFLSYKLKLIAFDYKLVCFLPLWIIANLFFVALTEEAFFRGFFQAQLQHLIRRPFAPLLSLFLVSTVFALSHLLFIPIKEYILVVWVASLCYGTIYHFTKSIEASAIAHFCVNLIHILFFTYPVLINK